MEEGGGRFPGILDPGAEEFRPKGVLDSQNTLFQPQFYYPCQSYPTAGGYEYHAPPRQVKPGSASATRTLLLSLVPQHLMEATVKRELEVFGEIRMVEMQRLAKEGMVTVHFYDVRHARTALMEIQEQHMRQQSRLGHHYSDAMMRNWTDCAPPMPVPGSRGLIAGYAVWAQFSFPTTAIAFGDGMNQGTLVVFNLDRSVSSSKLKEVFQVFGAVKELRETPLKREHRFVEFYDIRDAARALSEMNGKELCGKRIVVEFSRPGGRRFGNPTDSVPCNTNTAASSSSNSNSYYRKNTTANYLPRPPPPLPLPPRLFGQQRLRQNACSSRKCHNLTNKGKGQDAASTPSPPSSSSAGNGNEGDRAEENSKRNSRKQQRFQSKPFCRRFPSSKHKKKQSDGNFLFKEDAMDESICSDSRTTVMIKNIPNKYSQKLLLYMLDNHCIHCNEQIAEGDEDEPLSSYDFVYLPIDFINKCNVGYGFVNLTSPKAAWRLYKSFHFQPWEVFNSRKICQVTYARLQGLDALKEHFKNSKFACDIDEYMPVVFEPARDGKLLTEPVAIGGQASGSAKKAALAGSKSSEEETHDPTDGEDGCTSNQMDGGDDGEEDDGDEDDGDGRSTEAPVDLGHSNFPSSSSAPIAAC